MNLVQTRISNAYDVLGVSPDASAKEIDAVFHKLIEEGGYKVGVPLRGQWLRARQIKDAYAAIGDPIERRAYDESLKLGSERPLWPATPYNNPAEADLVQPTSEWQPPPEPESEPIADALSSGGDEPEQAPPEPESEPTADALNSGGDEPEQPPAAAIEPANDEVIPYVDEDETWPEDDDGQDEVRHGSTKLWASAAAAALAIGSLAYFTYQSETPELPAAETAGQAPAGAQQASPGEPMTGQLAGQPPAGEPDGMFGEVLPEGPGDTPQIADNSGVAVETTGASEAAAPAAAPDTVAVADQAQTQPDGPAVPGEQDASATAPAVAPSSGQEPPAAEAEAAAPIAPAPVAPRAPAANSSVARRSAGEVRSAAQWIGGGPTHRDNRGGRYAGSVIVQFTVNENGRVSNCGPARSSGNADLDAFTCRLVEQRMRFRPAVDGQGRPVASTAHARYEWGRRRRQPSLLSSIFR